MIIKIIINTIIIGLKISEVEVENGMSSLGFRNINKHKPTSRHKLEKFLKFRDKELTVSNQKKIIYKKS